MSDLKNNFSIYPYGYDTLPEKRAHQEGLENEERHRLQLADELSVDLGTVAMAAVTGIAGPEYKEVRLAPQSSEQKRKIGSFPVSNVVTLDRPSFMNSLENEQALAITEEAMLGRARQQAYDLAA
jgi:hypothetical protein